MTCDRGVRAGLRNDERERLRGRSCGNSLPKNAGTGGALPGRRHLRIDKHRALAFFFPPGPHGPIRSLDGAHTPDRDGEGAHPDAACTRLRRVQEAWAEARVEIDRWRA